jgi:hypothetical protein
MKKSLLFIVMLLCIIQVDAALKLAYVTDPAQATYANDTKIKAMFQADTSFVFTEIVATVAGQDLSGYDIIVIAEPAGSAATVVVGLKGVNKPVLNLKVFAYKTTVWNWVSANTAIVDNSTATNVVVTDASHAIFKGLNVSNGSEIQLISAVAPSKGLNGITAFNNVTNGEVKVLANIKDATTGQINVAEMPVGISMNGVNIQQKFVQIGISGTSYANVTEAGLKLVKNAAYYVSGLEIKSGVNDPKDNNLRIVQTSRDLTIESLQNLDLSVYSASGQLVNQTNGKSISIENLTSGAYILKLTNGKEINQNFKFVK